MAVGCAAHWRRMQPRPERRLSQIVDLVVAYWKEYSALEKGLTIALATSVPIAGGNASGYPTNLTVNETRSVIIGVANHEAATVHHTVRVDLVGVRIVYNATAGFNETVEVNRTTWTWINVTVADGANRTATPAPLRPRPAHATL